MLLSVRFGTGRRFPAVYTGNGDLRNENDAHRSARTCICGTGCAPVRAFGRPCPRGPRASLRAGPRFRASVPARTSRLLARRSALSGVRARADLAPPCARDRSGEPGPDESPDAPGSFFFGGGYRGRDKKSRRRGNSAGGITGQVGSLRVTAGSRAGRTPRSPFWWSG